MTEKNNIFDTGKGRYTNPFRTICEVHREIYDKCFFALRENEPETFEELTVLLNEAFDMGVRMDRKLSEIRETPEGELALNENIDEIREMRRRRVEISEQLLRHPQA